jgi:Spx/MgsR family transcriptional regulator
MARTALTSETTLHGIAHCDTVKRARAWLAGQGVACTFHDFAKAGVPAARLAAWVDACGWEALLNRKGTTWRKLDEATRSGVVGAATAMAVMRAHPSCIKRPVVEWAGGRITVGFDLAVWPGLTGIKPPR